MPELLQFRLYTHSLDPAQEALLVRVVEHFRAAQDLIILERCGELMVPSFYGCASWRNFLKQANVGSPEITVTGMPLDDNWFSHTLSVRSLITVADWHVAFHATNPPPAAPDAYLLHELTAAALTSSIGRPETEVTHYKTTGCISDMCEDKPAMAIKLQSGFLCTQCRNVASEAGISGVYLDAVQALMDRTRFLAHGRAPQSKVPPSPDALDLDYIRNADPPNFNSPPILTEVLRDPTTLTVLVGSGLSLQDDVVVTYDPALNWPALPRWTEISDRLIQRIRHYRPQEVTPRKTSTLRQFLIEMDAFKEMLGDEYYPVAIYDIFLPPIRNTGLVNRLLFHLPVRWILTTNYDFVLNFACPRGTATFTWREARAALEYITRANGPAPIVKLHGCASRPDTVILTNQEYSDQDHHQEYLALKQRVFSQHNILFLGYGMNDPLDLDLAIKASEVQGAAQGRKFALVPGQREEILREKFPNVTFLTFNNHDDLAKIIALFVRQSRGVKVP